MLLERAQRSDRTARAVRGTSWCRCLVMAGGFVAGGSTRSPWWAVAAFALTMVGVQRGAGAGAGAAGGVSFGAQLRRSGTRRLRGSAVLGGFIGPAFMGWARDVTGGYQRGLLLLALPSAIAAGLIYVLAQRRDAKAA